MIGIGKRIYKQDYVASNDGKISVRIDNKHIVITPSGIISMICKLYLTNTLQQFFKD